MEDYPKKIIRMKEIVRIPPPYLNEEKIGIGEKGGKHRGFEKIKQLLVENKTKIEEKFEGRVYFAIPKTICVGSSWFERFIEDNKLYDLGDMPDQEIIRMFLESKFSDEFVNLLKPLLSYQQRPLIVRSTNVAEDAERYSFAGVFYSVFIPNNSADYDVRMKQLEDAIKLVYASTFLKTAEVYRRRAGLIEPGPMAVLIQNVVGRERMIDVNGKLLQVYHPDLSFVGFSYDEYALRDEDPKNGYYRLTYGLGHGVVEGEGKSAVRISMSKPLPIRSMATPEEILENSPRVFYALDLTKSNMKIEREDSILRKIFIEKETISEEAIANYCEWYNYREERFGYDKNAIPLMTFRNIVDEKNKISVTNIVRFMRDMFEESLRVNVDFEGSIDYVGTGEEMKAVVYPLQLRPQARDNAKSFVKQLPAVEEEKVVLRTEKALGPGTVEIDTVVYIDPKNFSYTQAYEIKNEIARINAVLGDEKKRYALIVPGRLGTRDETLGVPVNFEDIGNATLIVEVPLQHIPLESSQGTHFFEDIACLNVAYLSSSNENKIKIERVEQHATRKEKTRFAEIYHLENVKLKLAIDEKRDAIIYLE